MPRRNCLTPEELRAFNLGDLPEAVLEELGAHLETCPRCEAAARALDAESDPVVAAYRESVLNELRNLSRCHIRPVPLEVFVKVDAQMFSACVKDTRLMVLQ